MHARQADRGRYAAHAKLRALLSAAGEELHDVPLYYSLHAMCKTLHTTPPSADAVRSALVNAGTASGFRFRDLGFWGVLKRCMRG